MVIAFSHIKFFRPDACIPATVISITFLEFDVNSGVFDDDT